MLFRFRQLALSAVAALAVTGAVCASAAPLAYIPVHNPAGLRVLDTATNTIVATIPLSDNPAEVAVTPDGKFAYVSLASTAAGGPGSTVAVISTASGSVIGNISVGEEPRGLAITPDGSSMLRIRAGTPFG